MIIALLLLAQRGSGQGLNRLLSQSFVFVNPTPLIDIHDGCSYRGGMEGRVISLFALCFEAGGYFYRQPGSQNSYHAKTDIKGYQLRPSVKYYPKGDGCGEYLQVEYKYKWQEFSYVDSINLRNGTTPVFEKKYHISRHVACINVKYGKTSVRGRFIFDKYIGGGITTVHALDNLSPDEEAGILKGEGHGDVLAQGGARNWYGPSLSFGIKIGYLFKKTKCCGSLITPEKPAIEQAKAAKPHVR